MTSIRTTVVLTEEQRDALKAIKERDGIHEAEQIRLGVTLWIQSKKLTREKPAKRRP